MSDFFDKNFAQGIVTGLIVLFVSILLAGRFIPSSSTGKGWKIVVIFSYVLFFGGLYLFLFNFQRGGLNNPYTGMGFSMTMLGAILNGVGKFFIWWHR